MGLKTNSKQVKEAVRVYIMECLKAFQDDGCPTLESQIDRVVRNCESAGRYTVGNGAYKMLSFNEAVRSYINGAGCFDFETYRINSVVEGWTQTSASDYDDAKTFDLFVNLIARELDYLIRKHNVQGYRMYLK